MSVEANRSSASGRMSRSDRNCCKRSAGSPVAELSSSADKLGNSEPRRVVFIAVSGGAKPAARLGLSPTLRSRKEVIDRRRIEVEHLGSCQFPFAYLIDAEDRRLQAVARWADGPLLPEDDDFFRTDPHDARFHSRLRLSRLQREPGICPRGTRKSAAIRERWRPGELDVGLAELEGALRVASLDRPEDLEHDLDVFAAAHDRSPRKSNSMTPSHVARISRST